MHSNNRAYSYWTMGSQFLRLSHEACSEIAKAGNVHTVVTDELPKPGEYSHIVRWSDHQLGAAVLFSFFHGIELILKGFLVASGVQKQGHYLTELHVEFNQKYPGTDLGQEVAKALTTTGDGSPLERFLAANSITIDNWYEALKYPESKNGTIYTHFDLKFGGDKTIPFWKNVQKMSANIHNMALSLTRKHGYA